MFIWPSSPALAVLCTSKHPIKHPIILICSPAFINLLCLIRCNIAIVQLRQNRTPQDPNHISKIPPKNAVSNQKNHSLFEFMILICSTAFYLTPLPFTLHKQWRNWTSTKIQICSPSFFKPLTLSISTTFLSEIFTFLQKLGSKVCLRKVIILKCGVA